MNARAARPRFGWHLATACLALWLGSANRLLQAAEPTAADLPLKRVVLFSSGVGFFEHSGEIDGDRTIEMHFDTAAINDLLKSMVVQDFGEGHVSTVTYGSREPLAKQLKSFSIDLARNPTIADLLRQLRGQRLAISMPNPIEGTVVGLERRQMPASKEGASQEIDLLNLKTATGLRSIPIPMIVEFRLLDEKLDKEFQDALAVLASAHSNDKKAVTLNFTGKGKRTVRVGYIQESPVWKTSYRLVLDDKGAPLLQGWAVVENTTEHDWKNVSVTLVSGRPISFIMDLYEPLYVDRPSVVPELFASLTSRTYDQDLSGKADLDALTGDIGLRIGGKPVRIGGKTPFQTGGGLGGSGGMMGGFGGGGFVGGGQSFGQSGGVNQQPMVTSVVPVVGGPSPGQPLDLKKGVASVAKAEEVGEQFRYAIGTPVTLAHSQSALLPIVNEPIKGQRVSIYNSEVQSKHPLAGLWLHNTTKLHLMQGPITVFDGGEYAGDAQIEDIAPGARRLISYALDLNVEATSTADSNAEELMVVKIVHGVLQATTKVNRRRQYTVKNSGDRAKRILIEQPIDAAWDLVSTKSLAEQSRDTYRFAVDVPENKTETLPVEEQRRLHDQVRLGVLANTDALILFRSAAVTSPKVKAALAELSTRLAARAELAKQRAEIQSQSTEIGSEQSRIRQNMQQLDKSSELFKRYVTMFGEQEDLIAKNRAQLKVLAAEQDKQSKELADFIDHLDVD